MCAATLMCAIDVQVEVTRFEDLEETHAEVKLKQTLWMSQKEWEQDYETWTSVSVACSIAIHFTQHVRSLATLPNLLNRVYDPPHAPCLLPNLHC